MAQKGGFMNQLIKLGTFGWKDWGQTNKKSSTICIEHLQLFPCFAKKVTYMKRVIQELHTVKRRIKPLLHFPQHPLWVAEGCGYRSSAIRNVLFFATIQLQLLWVCVGRQNIEGASLELSMKEHGWLFNQKFPFVKGKEETEPVVHLSGPVNRWGTVLKTGNRLVMTRQ